MFPPEAERVAKAYTAAMASARDGVLLDVKGLPYPKEQIKQALLVALSLTPPGAAREQMKFGFVALANWQDFGHGDARSAMLRERGTLIEELRAHEGFGPTEGDLDLMRRLLRLPKSDQDDVRKLIESREQPTKGR